ncbi:hypothetical protein [Quadrisphaera setariae]|uniref:hypothetical protein n=1 Tax=Quadrisphaera setariae TaxID=2593304 RepID=UPI001C9C612A|nr:hypothetical protein [Quadrisphaera setariae]
MTEPRAPAGPRRTPTPLQAPGSVGVQGLLSASSTHAPVALRVDDLSANTPR